MSHPSQQSASGLGLEHREALGKRSRARDDNGSRGSSAPSHPAGRGDVTGSQDDNVYVSVWFLACNRVCDPLRVWLCHVAPLRAGVHPHPALSPLGRYQRCSKQRAPGTAGYGWPQTWHKISDRRVGPLRDWQAGKQRHCGLQERCAQPYFRFVFPSSLGFSLLRKAKFVVLI